MMHARKQAVKWWCLIATLAVLLAVQGARAGTAPEDAIIAGLTSQDAAARQVAEADALKMGAPAIAPLCALYGGGDVALRRRAQTLLFAIAARATAPDAGEQAERTREALLAQMESKSVPARVRSYAAELMGIAGGGKDAGARLAAGLRDDVTFDEARAALQRLTGSEATAALVAAVPQVAPARRPSLLISLGARCDGAALKPLLAWAGHGDARMRAAALQALGRLGDAAAVDAAERESGDSSPYVRQAAVGALLALGDALKESDKPLAARLYSRAFAESMTAGQKLAAVIGLRAVGSPQFLPRLLASLGDEGAGRAAYRLLLSLDGKSTTEAVIARLPQAKGRELGMLLWYCEERPVPGGAARVLQVAQGKDEPARVAALEILARRPDPANVALFLAAGKEGSDPVKAAALSGYLSVAEAALKAGEKDRAAEMLRTALDLATGAPELRRALAGLAALPDPALLPNVRPLLDREELREDAAKAYLALADALAAAGRRQEAIDAYTLLVNLNPRPAAAKQAEEKLR